MYALIGHRVECSGTPGSKLAPAALIGPKNTPGVDKPTALRHGAVVDSQQYTLFRQIQNKVAEKAWV